mmetsp:Transcript_26063/g.61236  ORF Transcript_26063/g.61236 Transcript_26063/m.61236 type:complete len:80 (-) Transcript_26063:261-500(-)
MDSFVENSGAAPDFLGRASDPIPSDPMDQFYSATKLHPDRGECQPPLHFTASVSVSVSVSAIMSHYCIELYRGVSYRIV